MPEPKRPAEEDELDELPALDGGEGEEDANTDDGLLDEELAEESGDPFDDATGEDVPVEDTEISGDESGWLDDAGESDGLDVGTPEAFGAETDGSTLLEGAEEADDAALDEDLSSGGDPDGRSLVGDAGEEGFEDEEEEVREEDLPRLDADGDETEMDEGDLLGELPEEGVREEPRPPWDDRAWERVDFGLSGLAGVVCLAADAAGLVIAGQGVARVNPNGTVTALDGLGFRGGAPRDLATDGECLFVSTTRAGVLVSRDGGRSFQESNGWRGFPGGNQEEGLDLVIAGKQLWGRAKSGALFASGDRGSSWIRAPAAHPVDAIAADGVGGELVALARGPGRETLVGRSGSGEFVFTPCGELPPGRVARLVAHGPHLAAALAHGVFRAEAGAWLRLEGTAGATAVAFTRGDGSVAVALHSDAEGRAWILEARASSPAFVVAELGESGGGVQEDGEDARVRALLWDAERGVVWAAGGFGLCALRAARR
jgi:hypothetical protein